MLIAKVTGTVVSIHKIDALQGKKLMIVKMLNDAQQEFVAVDAVGVGVGELVLVSRGSPARDIFPEPANGIDLAIIAIVDSIS